MMAGDADIAIIGAGAAGLAAAKRARELGLTFVLIEAKSRIGGRTHTDTASLGVAWDRGAHWLHSASVNPLTRIADEFGHPYLKRQSFRTRHLHLGVRWADGRECDDYACTIDAAFDAVDALGAEGRDVPVAAALDRGSRWYRLIEHVDEAISGLPPEEISTLDLWHYEDTGENWPLVRGYGALIEAYGADIPVSLETAATSIDWSGQGVAIETPKGTIRARSAIVTVSTNVLARGLIRFRPGVPARLQGALENVRTGAANKVAFKFSRDVFGLPDTSHASFMDERAPSRHALSFQIRPFGAELAIAYLGGRFAAEMEAAGEAAMIETARDALVTMFGTSILAHLEKAVTTAWSGDPHTLGAYSCALPGHGDDRRILAEPIGGRVFLAGEAVHPRWFSTVQGAFLSGIDAVERAAAVIGHCSPGGALTE